MNLHSVPNPCDFLFFWEMLVIVQKREEALSSEINVSFHVQQKKESPTGLEGVNDDSMFTSGWIIPLVCAESVLINVFSSEDLLCVWRDSDVSELVSVSRSDAAVNQTNAESVSIGCLRCSNAGDWGRADWELLILSRILLHNHVVCSSLWMTSHVISCSCCALSSFVSSVCRGNMMLSVYQQPCF